MTDTNVIFHPVRSEHNDYVNLIVKSLEENGAFILNKNWKKGKMNFVVRTLFDAIKFKNLILHLNWIENMSIQGGVKGNVKCCLVLLFLRVFKLLGGKIVWTMHNFKPHAAVGNCYKTTFIPKLLKMTNLVVIHCTESKSILVDKYHYPVNNMLFVPHGNYCPIMDDYIKQNKEQNSDKVHFVYFGSISQYKGVEKLLDVFSNSSLRDSSTLLICGEVQDMDLKKRIESIAYKNTCITLDLSYISNERLGFYISQADVVVLPHEKESMQNSGTLIMALSCGKPVVIPLFGYVKDIEDKSFVFSYDYSSEAEQLLNLRNVMTEVCELHRNHPHYLRNLGQEAYIFAKDKLNWNSSAGRLMKEYQKLYTHASKDEM